MIVGCYTMDLYCDRKNPAHRYDIWCRPDQFVGETGAECRRQARKAGWKLDVRNGTAVCPLCSKAEKPPRRRGRGGRP